MSRKLVSAGLTVCVAMLVGACSSTETERSRDTHVETSDTSFVLTGPVDMEAARLLSELAEANPDIRRLIVRSEGGDPMAGIQLGYLLNRNQFTLEIDGYCLDSCANYLFTGAYNRVLREDAIVAWSGGATEESWVTQWSFYLLPGIRTVVEQYLDAFLRRETRFFDRIQVDQRITAYGFDANIGCMDKGDFRGFYYDSADLLVMGVGRTTRENTTWLTAFNHYPNEFCKVELDPVQLLK